MADAAKPEDSRKEIEQITLTDEKDRIFYEKVRRWKVDIKDIFITSYDVFEGFLIFIIGGDYVLEVYENPVKKEKRKMEKGKKGYTDATEFKEVLKVDSRVKFEKEFRFEHRDSIVNLMKQHIIIEVWEYNSLSMNRFKGRGMIEIIKIIKGNVFQFVTIERREGLQKKNVAKIEFKCFFQEMFDFKLTFQDWGGSNLDIMFSGNMKNDLKSFSPKLECMFKERGKGKIQADGSEGSTTQEWTAKGELYFRGTLEELEQQTLRIEILSSSDITKIFNLQRKAINYPLRGVALNGLVKKKVVADSSKSQKKTNKGQEGAKSNEEENRDPELCGKININNIPKFKQIGFDTVMEPNEVQICLFLKDFHVNYNSMFKLPESVFCTVEFNGKQLETDKIKLQILNKKFNQYFYFLFGEANEMSKCNLSLDQKHRAVKDTLKINNEVYIDIWLEDVYKCRDFLGRVTLSLLDIFDKGKPNDRKYKDDNFEVSYRPKISSSSDSFVNVFDIDAHLDSEIWFYPEAYTKDLNIKKNDKIFQKVNKVKKYEDIMEGNKDEGFKTELKKVFFSIPNCTTRFYGFDYKNFEIIRELDTMKGVDETIKDLSDEIKNFYVLDQFGEYRIINSYLSKLTVFADSNEYAESIKNNTVEVIIRQKRNDIDKVELGIGDSYESLMHYIKCMRYSYYDNAKKKRILLSPDIIMLNKKGNVFEHAIFFACILLNKVSEKEIVYEKYLEQTNVKTDDAIEDNESDKTIANTKIEGKETEALLSKDKNTSSINLLGDSEKSTNAEDVSKLNAKGNQDNKKNSDEKPAANKKQGKGANAKAKNAKDVIIEKIEPAQLLFVCMGTLKQEGVAPEMKKHMWIMKIESNFEDITFFDPWLLKTFFLKGRIKNKGVMEWYFNNKNTEVSNVDINKKKKPSKNSQKGKKDGEKRKNMGTINHRLNGDDDIDINLIVTKEEDFLKELDYLDNRVNIRQGTKVNKKFIDKSQDDFIQQNNLQKTSEIKIDDAIDPSKIKEFINFPMPYSKNGEKIRNDILPYKTLDVIFNKRNIWLNIQNHNPAGILFDIWDRDRWYPLIEKRDEERININHSDIPAFYSFKNFTPPFSEDELIQMKKNILKSLSNGIKLSRNQKNYSTTIKKGQQTQDLLDLYLIYLEMYNVRYLDRETYIKKLYDWKKNFHLFMRKKYVHKIYPLYFNYFSETLISSYIQENCTDFINDANKTVTFMVGCKIFQYPNRILSVRIILVASMAADFDPEEQKKMFQLSDEEEIPEYQEEPEKEEN